MRIYRGSDADIVLRPFMVRLSEIVSFDLQLWTSGTYTVKRSTSESGMTTDKENNLINVHFTDKETGYLDAGVLNAKLMYRITDSEYPDGTYDGIITIPQEYYLMTPPDFSGATIEKVYESGYTEGYNSAIQNSVLSINGEKGDLKLKTVNGNELLGEGDIAIDIGVESLNGQKGALNLKTIDNKDVLGEGNMDILSDYSICMFMMYNLTLSEADKGVALYKYGIGDDAANLDKYFSGLKTIQFLNFNIKDGASYKVPLTIFWDGDGNRQFRFVCEGYEYTYTSIDANYCDFTSKVKIGGESGLKYFDLTTDKAKEAYDEIQNHWDSLSGYTGDYVFRYKKDNRGVYTFSEIGYLRDHSVYFNYLDNADAYDVNTGNIKFFAIIIWKDGYKLQTYEHDFTIPTKTSQLTNDSAFQTKSEVDTAIENAVSGVGSGIVLDNLTQEERKAVYDKLDKTKNPDEVFFYNNTASVSAFWDSSKYLKFITIGECYKGLKTTMYSLAPNGSLDEEDWGMRYTNTLTIFLRNHVNETDPFECEYNGSFYEYLVRQYARPNAYFIWFWKGYGASTKPVYVPFSVEWDKYYDTEGEGPITIQFTIDGITYKYRNDLTKENSWQYDGKISIYDSHSINGFNGTSLVLGDAALDATDKNKYIDMRAMMGYDTIFNGDNDGSCPYLTIITTDNQMYKVPVWVKCNKQNDSTTRATFEFDLNGYHYLYTQDNQGDFTYSFTSKTPIGGGTSGDVPTKVSQLENDSKYINQSSQSSTYNIEHMWVGNQSQYDALETKDARTLFIII